MKEVVRIVLMQTDESFNELVKYKTKHKVAIIRIVVMLKIENKEEIDISWIILISAQL